MTGRKQEDKWITLVAPVTGKVISLDEVGDMVFSRRMVGDGIAIIPAEGKAVAPMDGVISHLFDTHHAVCIQNPNGLRVLIHIGLDTVKLYGEGFKSRVRVSEQVKKSELLIEFDLDVIEESGCSIVTPMVINNMELVEDLQVLAQGDVQAGHHPVLKVRLK
ncbi:PTS sugar transporter subunit IIA [Thermoflavimicrobium dichotomicum]|uniref:PTS system, glucose-specific IIA component n=1 Tax=Thermoflavimicrobium dichotomicum TaxID=46223 RepID=A0A1I3TNM4_9BACL|nr:PTS glucose transporter subunit IIA [Thermoflavimicrobium dichotomicum]SFJ71221.1 PTS system, glucose-specific IIA component [Thermoflavimicrobium dichotomicum]